MIVLMPLRAAVKPGCARASLCAASVRRDAVLRRGNQSFRVVDGIVNSDPSFLSVAFLNHHTT